MPEGTIHLSALMCAEHRSDKIAFTKQKLLSGEDIKVIRTQLIEAGVDIDFPVVYRAFAGLNSIVQTAGRCNREGKLKSGEVFVFYPPKDAPAGLLRKSVDAAKEIMSCQDFDINDEEVYKSFFKAVINRANSIGKEKLEENLFRDAYNQVCQFNFQFASYAKDFNLIDDKCNKPIIVKYNNQMLIEELKYTGVNRQIMRKLQRYIVNIPKEIFDHLQQLGLIENIADNIFVQGDYIYKGENKLYSEEAGLNIYGIDLPQSCIL
jgi:CRISPR-associated endonuclease/helicase Cas3